MLLDKDTKNKNDRTWCYWENKTGFFEDVVYKKWQHLNFYGDLDPVDLEISPYQYKMIRAIDFYNYCFDRIREYPNIDIVHGNLKSVDKDNEGVTLTLEERELRCAPAIVFNSVFMPGGRGNLQLLQHFKGWVIEAGTKSFNEYNATLMDFRVQQVRGTSFMYLLPLTETRALIEYTLFTAKTLESHEYDIELRDYIDRFLQLGEYKIIEEEFGIIPMTNTRFQFFENGMYNIGIAGGQTKASTGYTFQFIQKQSEMIIDCLIHNNPLDRIRLTPKRFLFYDHVLLQLLSGNRLGGKEIFTRMFTRNNAAAIFKFLDNETTLIEELKLISTLQTMPFVQAAMKVVSR